MSSNKMNIFLKERTTIRIMLTAMIVALVGLLLLVWSVTFDWWIWMGNSSFTSIFQKVMGDVGSLLVATAAISLLWELAGKRAFLDELLPKMRLSEDILKAGVVGLKSSLYRDFDWEHLFLKVKEIDLLFTYGVTWYRLNTEQLKDAANRHVQIRVVLPDPDDKQILSELARHFDLGEEQIKSSIHETVRYFQRLQISGAKINIWFLHTIPTAACIKIEPLHALLCPPAWIADV